MNIFITLGPGSSQGLGEFEHMLRLARALVAHRHKVGSDLKQENSLFVGILVFMSS